MQTSTKYPLATRKNSSLSKPLHYEATPTFRSPESLIYSPCGPHRRPIYPPVEEQHDEHRNVEGPQRRIQNIPYFAGELAGAPTARVVR